MSNKIEISRELAKALTNVNGGKAFATALHELRTLLAAAAVKRQEAVAWALLNGNGQIRDLTDRWDVAKHWDGIVQSLYDSPPAPVAVVVLDEQQAFADWTHEVVGMQGLAKVQRRDLMSVDDEKLALEAWQARANLDKVNP